MAPGWRRGGRRKRRRARRRANVRSWSPRHIVIVASRACFHKTADLPTRSGPSGLGKLTRSAATMNASKVKFAYLVCAGALLLAGHALAEEGGKPISRTTISLGTATPGGGFPLYGNAFAEMMNAADPTLSIEPRNTKGSNENIPLLDAGQLDIALVAGEPAYEAFMGLAGRPRTSAKILTAMYSSPGMFVVRADSPYKTIHDLVGQPVAFGARGSGLPILSRYVLDGLGLKQDEDFKAIYLDRAGDGPALVLDG